MTGEPEDNTDDTLSLLALVLVPLLANRFCSIAVINCPKYKSVTGVTPGFLTLKFALPFGLIAIRRPSKSLIISSKLNTSALVYTREIPCSSSVLASSDVMVAPPPTNTAGLAPTSAKLDNK